MIGVIRGLVASALAVVAACACSSGAASGGGGGPGPGGGTGSAGDCEAARSHVVELYRADPKVKADPKISEQTAMDATGMVMSECTREPGRVARCAAAASSVAELETKCLAPLDDEGTEGDRFLGR